MTLETFKTQAWWNEEGPFKMLHLMTPLRIKWILQQIDSIEKGINSLQGKKVLDVGCGGGLLTEPLARLGAQVTGIDPSEEAILCARAHSEGAFEPGQISYHVSSFQDWGPPTSFDLIVMMEVLEHIAHPFEALAWASRWLAPGGRLVGSTLNRTWLSYALAIVAAEKILKWIPKGTHQWADFLKPDELRAMTQAAGMEDFRVQGFEPLRWRYTCFEGVNYFFSACKPKEEL